MRITLSIILLISVFSNFDIATAQLNQSKPAILEEIGVDEKLGESIPMDLEFVNSEGQIIRLSDLIEEGKPVLLNPLYYECPTLCGLVLDAVYNVVNELAWSPGRDYTIISFSIDPNETPEIAANAKQRYLTPVSYTHLTLPTIYSV